MFTLDELERIRQWFDAVQDLNPSYLEDADIELQRKILLEISLRKESQKEDDLRCPHCNCADICWKDEYHLGWCCRLCGTSFHRPVPNRHQSEFARRIH